MTIPILDPITVTNFTDAPDIGRLTTAIIEGTGVFDVLMKATKAHLLEEYESGRIDNNQYSEVYLGALGAVLQQSVTYLLNNQSEKKTFAEIGLIRQKIATELSNTSDTILDGLAFNNSTTIQGVVNLAIQQAEQEVDLTEQKLVTELSKTSDVKPSDLGIDTSVNIVGHALRQKVIEENQALLTAAQTLNAEVEKTYLGQKVVTELSQTADNLGLATALGYGLNGTEGSIITLGVTKGIINQTAKQTDLIEQKISTELSQTNDAESGVTFSGLVKAEKDLKIAQTATATAEKDLVGQKIISELSQTGDEFTNALVDYGYNTVATLQGLLESKLNRETQEIDLIEQKIVTELGQSSDIKPTALGQMTGVDINGLIKTKRETDTAQTSAITAQALTSAEEKALIIQKTVSELAQTNSAAGNGGVIKGTVDKMTAEEDLLIQKEASELLQSTVLTNQAAKITAEKDLLIQKKATEVGQISNTGVTGGIIGAQTTLYAKQTDGFDRDAEQKLAKIAMDAWSVDVTVGATTSSPLGASELTTIINKAMAGIA